MLLSCAAHPLIRHVQMYGQNNRTNATISTPFSVVIMCLCDNPKIDTNVRFLDQNQKPNKQMKKKTTHALNDL